jgi:BirA family biotin operon repressor/biotin-[acetyl-CoA-carboxylase] ligase
VGINGLSAAAITRNLKTRFVGQRVLYFPSVSSTMELARREVSNGAPEGTVIVADEQTAGRGRLQRTWLTPKGNVALSVIFYPKMEQLPALVMLASLAVVHGIRTVTGLDPGIKWPNDVLINGRKVCGILIESDVRDNNVHCAIVGIGVNVGLMPDDYPEISDIATSLSQEAGTDINPVEIVRALLVEIERLYLELAGGRSLHEEWHENMVTLGQPVHVRSGKKVYEGIAEAVNQDGSLLLRQSDGVLISIIAGDVTLRS